MQLENLSIVLRKRTAWEAIDLGGVLVRDNLGLLMKAWLLAILPVVALSLLLALTELPSLALFLIWWVRPWYDRVMLYALSQRMFGEVVTAKQIVQAMPKLMKSTGLISGLTIRRFSLSRSFRLPIWQLEGLRGKALSERSNVLSRRSGSSMVMVTFLCVHLEFFMYFALIALIIYFAPAGFINIEDFWGKVFTLEHEENLTLHAVNVALTAVCYTFVQPLFLASGFALYLARRCELEAWDLELQLRLLAKRLASLPQSSRGGGSRTGGSGTSENSGAENSSAENSSAGNSSVSHAAATVTAPNESAPTQASATLLSLSSISLPAITLVGALLSAVLLSTPAWAEDDSKDCDLWGLCKPGVLAQKRAQEMQTSRDTTPEREAALAVVKGDEFNNIEKDKQWRVRWESKNNDNDSPNINFGFWDGFAKFMRGLAWLVGGVLLIWIIYKLATGVDWNTLFTKGKFQAPPEMLFGLDVRPESLPPDVAGQARQLLAAGDIRGALSLLFRASLVRLIAMQVPLQSSDTEGDCERRVDKHQPQLHTHFKSLSAAWQMVAYAHRLPSREQVSALIEEWAASFGATAQDKSQAAS